MTVFARLRPQRSSAIGVGEPVSILAPLSGPVVDLGDAPDEAFATGALGEGVAIDPTSASLLAPCDGEVVSIARTNHAATIRAPNGAEILLHIGIETVSLGGAGFTPRVRQGALVRAGDALIGFDMDMAARKARSLVTPIVIVNGDEFAVLQRTQAREVAAGDFLMEVARCAPAGGTIGTSDEEFGGRVVVRLAHGVHARPAAQIAAKARGVDATVEIRLGAARADARSISSLMSLGVRCGEEVAISARGREARDAFEAVRAVLAAGAPLNEVRPDLAAATFAAPREAISGPTTFRGLVASPGVGIGAVFFLAPPEADIEEAGEDPHTELRRLEAALASLRERLSSEIACGAPHGDILEAHAGLLEDPALVDAAVALIADGKSAAFAWRRVMRAEAAFFQAMEDKRMAERAADFMDLEKQVLETLAGTARQAENLPENAILIADELYPSDLLNLDRTRVAAICTARGGPTSHASIIAAGMGLPAVVAAGPRILDAEPGSTVVVDADKGEAHFSPDDAFVETARRSFARRRERRTEALAVAVEDCRTADGARIGIFANVAGVAEAACAMANHAEGCGLLRTEFLFLGRSTPPSEDEQVAHYQAIADTLAGKPLVVRTLDIAADKPVPYMQLESEENPALGVCGVRASLARPDLLRTQLRAILRVRPEGRCRILLPMIASVDEIDAVRAILGEIRSSLGYERAAPLGAMVETPAAALLAGSIAEAADFLSIGTNDLSQYTLAMDRTNPRLAAGIDAMNPAVLRLVRMTGEAGARCGKPVNVCGSLASDLEAAPLLIGLGVGALSAAAARIPELKAFVRTLRKAECEEAARAALDLKDGAAVRALVRRTWPHVAEA